MSKINLKNIKNKLNDDIIEYEYEIPIKLYESIKSIIISNITIKNNTDKRCLRRLNNCIDHGMYFALYLLHAKKILNQVEDLENNPIQISKEILCNVLNNKIFWEIKDLLIKNNIILKKEIYSNKNKTYYYSKNSNTAISYYLNSELIGSNLDKIKIKNKYMDKHIFLMRNNLLFGNKRNTINEEYLPYKNPEKNKQYFIQKKIEIDENKFKEIFLKNYPCAKIYTNIWEIMENSVKDNKIYANFITDKMLFDYKTFLSFKTHCFRCTESYGRIYMPFQYMSKEYRNTLTYNNQKLYEIYDMKCCFVQLAARLFKKTTEFKEEANKLLEITKNDIYKDIAKKENITRLEAKNNMMIFLFSSPSDRKKYKNTIYDHIKNYFKSNFINFYNWVILYKLYKIENDRIVTKLSIDCFNFEADLMFNHVLPYLENKYKEYVFISLHDGIWTTENNNNIFKEEIENLINTIN